jgi:predicted secreted protein with PEFG-CTERM motif
MTNLSARRALLGTGMSIVLMTALSFAGPVLGAKATVKDVALVAPEFGPVSALIFAIAIIGIVVASAKFGGNFSMIPKR